MSPELHTTSLHDMLDRFRSGDATALDELIRRSEERLRLLARRMLHAFPDVRAHEQSGDVLQNALIRLTRALRDVDVRPNSTAEYFGLAAEQVRRALLDLARHHRRRSAVNQPLPPETSDPPDPRAADDTDLDRWAALHEAVEELPADPREVFRLKFYHGWTQAEIARLLDVSDRQVRRLWSDACLRLHELLGGNLPPE
jgi:RNA polymerase sigma-70 factor (ECF subfamily)